MCLCKIVLESSGQVLTVHYIVGSTKTFASSNGGWYFWYQTPYVRFYIRPRCGDYGTTTATTLNLSEIVVDDRL